MIEMYVEFNLERDSIVRVGNFEISWLNFNLLNRDKITMKFTIGYPCYAEKKFVRMIIRSNLDLNRDQCQI